jgi:hypothetical protein
VSCNNPQRRTRFTIVTAQSIANALTSKLVPCIDAIRNINTTLGAYAYSVWLVHTRWSGGERGEGVEELLSAEPVLPTPCLGARTALEETIQSVGRDEVGTLTMTEISLSYTQDCLLGNGVGGAPCPLDQNFYWEVRFPQPDGTTVNRRFLPRSVPSTDSTSVQWIINLIRASDDRSRLNGTPEG